jgi:SAM-dependent methyltransferase
VSAAEAVIWHDVECGAYEADLPLWEELADEAAGPLLELGCGTGRVCLHLARRGHRVTGLDRDGGLLAAARERGGDHGPDLIEADAGGFGLDGRRFALVLAPMQLLQLLDGVDARVACLAAAAAHLDPGGVAALAIVDSFPAPEPDLPPLLPDVREVDGWVYSSLPVDAMVEPGRISVRRLRQTVSPEGALRDEQVEIRLETLSAAAVEAEGRAVGLRPAGRREIAPTESHVGSTVVLLRKEGR